MRLIDSPRLTLYLNVAKPPDIKCPQHAFCASEPFWRMLSDSCHFREMLAELLVLNFLSAHNNGFISCRLNSRSSSCLKHLNHACCSQCSMAAGSCSVNQSLFFSYKRQIPEPLLPACAVSTYWIWKKGNRKQEPGPQKVVASEYGRMEKRSGHQKEPGSRMMGNNDLSEHKQKTADCKSTTVLIIFRWQSLRHKKQLLKILEWMKTSFSWRVFTIKK